MRISEKNAEETDPHYIPVKVAELIDQRGYAPADAPEDQSLLKSIGAPFAAAAGFLLLALMLSSQYNRQATENDARATTITAQVADIREKAKLLGPNEALQLRQYDALKREGVPIAALMDDLALAVSPGVGLTAVTVKPNRELVIKGEAGDEASMLRTLENMRPSPFLRDLSVVWFGRKPGNRDRLVFEFRGGTVSMAEVKIGQGVKP